MTSTRYYCPFDCETTIIKLPIETDNDDGKSRRYNQASLSITPLPFKFIKCRREVNDIDSVDAASGIQATQFYRVDSFWDFDNVGVSKPVINITSDQVINLVRCDTNESENFLIYRYLTCGGCDKGAVGFGGVPLKKDVKSHAAITVIANANDLIYFVTV
ncbi:hypothetical protein FOA43_004013 [Brettanomyces nanus]|uniref:Uncharacterized protein n=1 Tax=Eeniella nana TaxID=13502 RepID=A0A875S4Q7_EENNA|nr:uncharacterized protein FOA43_004013 [Brettanomyces nanus]QPG76621.1 hypothetical protein FOA43_004013 [Brettanomyces nanus]